MLCLALVFYHSSKGIKAMEIKFDPFNDRLARDIRNALSAALVESLPALDVVNQVSTSFLADQRLLPHHKAYISERLQRYQAVQKTITTHKVSGIVCPALAMWDEKLFFEVHECLEGEWYPAPAGDRKKALQALICAAGTFVHIKQDNKKGAAKMSARAIKGLEEYGHALPELGTAKDIIVACLDQQTTAPRIFANTQCASKH